MDATSKTIKISNFDLSKFGNLLNQSLMVTPQLMIEINDGMIKSCSFSQTKSFIKLWTIPMDSLIIKPVVDNTIEMFENLVVETKLDLENFNFYILKGDLFKRFITVHNQTKVDLEFSLELIDNKYQATTITIIGTSELGSSLKTTFTFTTEEMISNKIADYASILKECSPTEDMYEICLSDKQISETKSLIKKLHKSSIDNSAFLSIYADANKIKINDKVFTVEFEIDQALKIKSSLNNKLLSGDESLSFNILKSDFIITGDHTFNIFAAEENEKVIIVGRYAGSIISCLTTKITDNSATDDTDFGIDGSDFLEDLQLQDYI